MKYKDFFRTKGVRAALFMGIFYVVAMLGIFLPGYGAIPGNIDRLPIAIVNEDRGEYGSNIAENLADKLPFNEIAMYLTNKEALEQLEENEIGLVIRIPETFSEDMQKSYVSSSIDFTVNEAGPTVVSTVMTSVVTQIANELSSQFSEQTAQGILMNFNVPEGQATEMAAMIEDSYVGNVVTINEIPAGLNNTMLPMFITMSGYVGAMIGALQLIGSFKASRGKASKVRLFMYVQLTALIIAVLSALSAVGVAYLVNEPSGDLFLGIVGQQILHYMVSFNFTAILIFLLGNGGMILNLPILLMQTLANGSTIPRSMMYAPFEWLSHISPMYHSIQAHFANLYGSANVAPHIWHMVMVGAGAMLINILIVWKVHKPLPVDAPTPAERKEAVNASTEITT